MAFYSNVINQLKLLISTEQREINILLLGETGVGKSTFINSFANYLTYPTLREAQDNNILALIPTTFTVTGEDYESHEVSIGQSDNEDSTPGQSATQQCKSFVFPFGERLVRLIDTPGVGDTRGVEQDSRNFEDILGYIGNFKEIHCICILLKPNNARITITFEYCLKQLLSHLQKSASDNMVFVFTNSRATFYRPGNTAVSLRQVLKKVKESPPHVDIVFSQDNTFCVDNEAFRFLVALKNGVHFAESDFADFAQSWEVSAKQCHRLVQYIIGTEGTGTGLSPHRVKDTQSVNEARRLITLLTQPLAEIAQNIDDNIYLMALKKKEIHDIGDNIEEMKKHLFIPYHELEIIELKEPQTVCSSETCVTKFNVHGVPRFDFKKCHAPCDIYGVQRQMLGDARLKKCEIFKWYKNYSCSNCGCSYKKHLHVYYETKVTEEYREDEKMSELIEKDTDAIDLGQRAIENLDNVCKELNHEMGFIMKTTAKFTKFLKHNAIAPYNDTFKCYLSVLLENETNKREVNHEMVIRMQNMLKEYEKAKKHLRSAPDIPTTPITVDEVFRLIDELYSLKNYGKKIRQMRESQESARMSEMSMGEREVRYDPDLIKLRPKPVPRPKAKDLNKEEDSEMKQGDVKKNDDQGCSSIEEGIEKLSM